MTTSASTLSTYPIELSFPDIRAHAQGNTGIPYLYTFDSGKPGPHTMINALTHGNEVCGAIVVKELLEHGLQARKGSLTLAFANFAAYARFDAANPDVSRFIDQDFNRVWRAETLDDLTLDSSELRRARQMRPVIDTVDFLLDIHSMHERSAPLTVCGPLAKGKRMARELGMPAWVISDEGHPEGRRMRDYAAFGDPASSKNALLIECGQHWEANALTVARSATARFLLMCGTVEREDLPAGWLSPVTESIKMVEVTDPVVAHSTDFRFAGTYTGLETFAETGTVIGWRDGEAITTPYPNCVLVMPSLRHVRAGVTVVRFGRLLDSSSPVT